MSSSFLSSPLDANQRDAFHRRSLEHQKPLSVATMAFSVAGYLIFVFGRCFAAGPQTPLAGRLACAVLLGVIVWALTRSRTTRFFGAMGVAYTVVLVLGVALNVEGVAAPLIWLLPSLLVISVGGAPLWLTPRHFVVGTVLLYAVGVPLIVQHASTHDQALVVWMWLLIGISTSIMFHFGFYWFRRQHFLLESQLAQLAGTDPLTGLQNRRAFMKQAEQRLAAARPALRICAIFLDIDSFKSLNDRYGHATGDEALHRVARALIGHTRPGDSVSRMGGEEFAVLCDSGIDGAIECAERLRAAIGALTRPDGHLSASFGVAEYRHGESVMTLLDRADEALLRAKHSGRNRVCGERLPSHQSTRLTWRTHTAADGRIVERRQWDGYTLTSYFQPLFSLSHQKQIGFEALLRGEHANGTLVPPVVLFTPKPPGDEAALDRASHAVHLAEARALLPEDAWLFLNILPVNFVAEEYADELAGIARAAGVDPAHVVLELLESHGGGVDEMSRAAARFRNHGFLIAVDDFGAGHSNLDRLFRIQPDLVKLDGELIRATSPGSARPMLPKLVSLLHQAGMLVVVEGIETTDQLILAVQANVDFAQGYLLGVPLASVAPPDAVQLQIDRAFDAIAQGRAHQHALFESEVEPYRAELRRAADALTAGAEALQAFAALARFEHCISCFILDDSGRQIGVRITGRASTGGNPTLHPLTDPLGDARWDHRPYFRNAVLLPGVPLASNPYLSLGTGKPCLAVTMAIQIAGRRAVIGIEVDWSMTGLPWPAHD